MSLSKRNLNINRFIFSYLTLGFVLLVVTVSAQGQRVQFIIRVEDEEPEQLSDPAGLAVGDADGDNGGNVGNNANAVGEFNFGVGSLNAATTGLGGFRFGAADFLQAPDVVVEGLNLFERNTLVAAAAQMQKSLPQQRVRLALNSGLRRRSVSIEGDQNVY